MLVDVPGLFVVGGEGDIALLSVRDKVRIIAGIQFLDGFWIQPVVPYLVQDPDEAVVRLSIDVLELNGYEPGLGQGVAAEKVDCRVVLLQKLPFLRLGHRGKLMQIAYHEQLHSAKGLGAAAVPPQGCVHGIQQVGPDHADLVDNQEVQALNDVLFLLADPEAALLVPLKRLAPGHKRTEGQLEEGMQGYPSGIQGSHPGGSGGDHPLAGSVLQPVEKRGLACARFSGQKDMLAGLLYIAFSQLQLPIGLPLNGHRHSPENYANSCQVIRVLRSY